MAAVCPGPVSWSGKAAGLEPNLLVSSFITTALMLLPCYVAHLPVGLLAAQDVLCLCGHRHPTAGLSPRSRPVAVLVHRGLGRMHLSQTLLWAVRCASPERKGTWSCWDRPEEVGTYVVTREMGVGGWQAVADRSREVT